MTTEEFAALVQEVQEYEEFDLPQYAETIDLSNVEQGINAQFV